MSKKCITTITTQKRNAVKTGWKLAGIIYLWGMGTVVWHLELTATNPTTHITTVLPAADGIKAALYLSLIHI